MPTVVKLEQMIAIAERAGYTVRMEWLGGTGGGACEFAGRKWIFIDLALSVVEQLEQVTAALNGDSAAIAATAPATRRQQLAERRAA